MDAVLRRYQLAMGLTLVSALCFLFYGRAQAVVPVDTSVPAADMRFSRASVATNGTEATVIVNNTTRNLIVTDLSIALGSAPDTDPGVAATDVIHLRRYNAGGGWVLVDTTTFVQTGGAPAGPSVLSSTHTKAMATGLLLSPGQSLKAVATKLGTGALTSYHVNVRGYLQ